jgi:hypothetical protein
MESDSVWSSAGILAGEKMVYFLHYAVFRRRVIKTFESTDFPNYSLRFHSMCQGYYRNGAVPVELGLQFRSADVFSAVMHAALVHNIPRADDMGGVWSIFFVCRGNY